MADAAGGQLTKLQSQPMTIDLAYDQRGNTKSDKRTTAVCRRESMNAVILLLFDIQFLRLTRGT